jgi:hypothetical protein
MSATLERRYRWLLALFPRRYRQEYEEEVLTVLLAGAREGQRHPGARESLDLLLHALRTRLGREDPVATTGREWRDAAAVFGLVTSVLLVAKYLRPVVSQLGYHLRDSRFPVTLSAGGIARIAVWCAVVAAVLIGRRLVAATLATAAAAVQAIVLATRLAEGPGPNYQIPVLALAWPVALALLAAAALSVAVGGRRATIVLGRSGTVLVGLSGLTAAVGAIGVPLLSQYDDSLGVLITRPVVLWVAAPTYGVLAVLYVLAVARIEAPTRRRVLALAAPTVTLFVVVQLGLDFAFSGAIYVEPPVLPAAARWTLMLAVPVIVLGLSLLLIRLRESRSPSETG